MKKKYHRLSNNKKTDFMDVIWGASRKGPPHPAGKLNRGIDKEWKMD